jgi:hypothetical protein
MIVKNKINWHVYIVAIYIGFFNLYLLSIDQIIVPGKKIKKNKNKNKNQIKENIINTMNYIKDIDIYTKPKKTNMIIENLSNSAQERYKLENNFVTGIVKDPQFKKNIEIEKIEHLTFEFIINNYDFIEQYMKNEKIIENSPQYALFLLFFEKNLKKGLKMQTSLEKALLKTKNINFEKNFTIIEFIYKMKEINTLQKHKFDNNAQNILNKIILFNHEDKIELDRAINRLYNFSNRHPVLIIIEQYHKNNFTIKENNNTYGELGPDKEIYQKIFFNKNKLEEIENQDRNLLSRRHMPETKPKNIFYYAAFPYNNSNIITYKIFKENNKKPETQKIENIIKNLDSNYFYSISILTEKDLKN